ncbi:helix-hairpin-helix domain-containing protein [Natrialba swarupiae]|uniref:helix-hairpin-helix domain-containing protein n=1 Tax=Natrialba swarupiae TaxID=2448032 RepID=UPI001390DC5D|nr:helix-hairpin-helix domain-containing protein [Natrialba swarupiae]
MLDDIPGIGETRAEALRTAGYDGAADVAAASACQLRQTPKISETVARCIQATAREQCGWEDTFISEIAESVDADRTEVADAYADLAAALVPPESAEKTLELHFRADVDRSVVQLDEYAIRYRHYLLQAGFDRIGDVAQASVDELTEARYIGDELAQSLKETAQEKLDRLPETRESSSDPAADSTRGGSGQPTTNRASVASGSTETDNGDETAGIVGDQDGESGRITRADETSDDSDLPDGGKGNLLESKRFPQEMVDRDQWLLWKQTDDGRKIPRAPWETGDALRYVDAMNPMNWTSFQEAVRWQSKLPHDLHLAYAITRDDDVVFLDLDDVVVNGDLSRAARDLVDEADSYAAISTSGTGVHVFASGRLSEDVKSLTGSLDETGDQTLEVYDRNRFVAMTGDHLEGSPTQLTNAESLLTRLEDEFASISSETPDRATGGPERGREELRELETTNDIQDVFDAINQVRPSDIKMRSTQTREHGDGTYSYDPSWVHSESGTRLGVLDDIWIYRKGMIALNALQVVALEEGIILDEQEYPQGEAFWEAVEALRDRGAHIPKFEPHDEPAVKSEPADGTDEIDESEIAKRINYGDTVRTYVHPRDRDYQEQLALELTPILVEAATSLHLTPTVTYRAAELYAKGHAAGVVPGAAHECSLGAAIRIASIETGTPRPLADIAEVLDERPKSIRQKFHRLIQETTVSDTLDASDLVVDPPEYVPYLARQLGREDDAKLREQVRELLDETPLDGGSNPMSEVAAAFYVAMTESPDHSVTQDQIADAAGLTAVTIRNNYRKFAEAPSS